MEKTQSKRSRIVGIRLTFEEFNVLTKRWKMSTSVKLSDYVRNVLFDKPIVTTYRNKSMDDLIAELTKLRQELNHIGVNYNQSVKRLHTLRDLPEFKRWMIANEVQKRTLDNKLEEIKSYFKNTASSWLQK